MEAALIEPGAEVGCDVLAGREGGAKLVSRLGWLAAGALAHEGPPTQGMREVALDIARAMEEQERALDGWLAEVAEVNAESARLGVPHVVVAEDVKP